MPLIEIDENDARQQARAATLKGASIRTGDGKPEVRCLIRNISPEGAELDVAEGTRVPQHFTLHVPHESMTYRAQVRWREDGRLGVQFNGVEKSATPFLKKIVG